MDVAKIGVGSLLLVVSSAVLTASGTVSSPTPLFALALAPLGVALAAALVGRERRPV